MTPVESLCLQCIKHWIRIVQHNKGSCGEIDRQGTAWTRCSATEVASWIGEHFEAEVSPRSCQNALRSLEESGRVNRQKRQVNRWTQAYSYSLPTTGQSNTPQTTDQLVPSDQSDVPKQANHSYRSTYLSTKKSAVGSKQETDIDVDGLQVPKAQEPTSQDKPKPRHQVIRRSSEDEKATVDRHPYQSPINSSGDAPQASQGHSESGIIDDVHAVESHRLLSEIERTTLDDLGAPDLKINPTAYLNWVMDRREKQSRQN